MDPNPFSNPPMGYILFGLAMVLLLGAVVYALGVWGAEKMRQGRIEDSTDIPYPERPRSTDDRKTVSRVRAEGSPPDRIVSDAQLDELALGADRAITPQTPTTAERPVDAADRDDDHERGREKSPL